MCDLMRTANSPRRLAGWALVAGLCLAALVAVFALLSGNFDDTDWRIIGSSLGFSLFSAIGAAGESLRRAGAGAWLVVGSATVLLAAAAFLLLLAAIWIEDDADWLWRAWGCCALGSLAGSHASIVMRGARPDDGGLIRTLIWISIVTASIDTAAGLLAISAVFDDIGEGVVEGLSVIGVAMLLSTALPPILRRLRAEPGAAAQGHLAFGAVVRPALQERQRLTAELEAIAQRLEELDTSPEIRSEAANLRRLARERQA
jgi:hypothetical protein